MKIKGIQSLEFNLVILRAAGQDFTLVLCRAGREIETGGVFLIIFCLFSFFIFLSLVVDINVVGDGSGITIIRVIFLCVG